MELAWPGRTGLLVGAGAREAERLESGGQLHNPGYPPPLVPRFEEDGRTQLGTGFREATFDARLEHAVAPRLRLVSALYSYRQYDAPRTDQCPPPEAPVDECLIVIEQARTLGYVALRGDAGRELREIDLNLSIQRHDEQRVNDRPRSFVQNSYDNARATLALAARAADPAIPDRERLELSAALRRRRVSTRRSSAAQALPIPELRAILEPEQLRFARSRGQYRSGSNLSPRVVCGGWS